MKRIAAAVGVGILVAGSATAGGLEQSVFPIGILFEEGGAAQVSAGHLSPDVGGVQALSIPGPGGVSPVGARSGNVANDRSAVSLALKFRLSDQLDLALVLDEPVAADVAYAPATGYVLGGARAKVTSRALTGVLKYRIAPAYSLYGGLRLQQARGEARLASGYSVTSDRPTDAGVLLGAAYERPDIRMRLSLTYESAIRHRFDAIENGLPSAPFTTEVPQALTMNLQSGIAPDTLLFGALRWRDWSAFDISPVGLKAATGQSLVDYDGDTVTAMLGLGRRFSDHWSGAVQVTRDSGVGGLVGNLSPVDGYTGVGLGLTYSTGAVKVTGALSYTRFDKIRTEAFPPAPPGAALSDFRDSSAIGAGMSVAFSF